MEDKSELMVNFDKIHTTELGKERIKKNLCLTDTDVVKWCKKNIQDKSAVIYREGKNWYIAVDNCVITVNAYSYTIITAHKVKNK
jgi:hypothetical protein